MWFSVLEEVGCAWGLRNLSTFYTTRLSCRPCSPPPRCQLTSHFLFSESERGIVGNVVDWWRP